MAVRKRIGLLVPSTNTTAEPDVQAAVPEGVTVHSHRLWIANDVSKQEAMDRMNSELAQGARYLASAKVDAICITTTTNTVYKGASGGRQVEDELSRIAAVPTVVSSISMVQALRRYGAKRISVATPYIQFANDRLEAFLTAAGFQVLNIQSDPRVADGHSQHVCDQDPEEILEFATSVCRDDADALVCAHAGWRVMEVAAEIERRTGRMVITSNQATVWRTLQAIGISVAKPGFGKLLDEMLPVEDRG